MTPAARYQATIELWDKIIGARVPMDSLCGDYFRIRRYIGSKDRANIAERVYNMMRAHARLSWWCDKTNLPCDGRSFTLLTACLIDGVDEETLPTLFNGKKYHPDALSDIETTAVKTIGNAINHPDMPENIRAECPDFAYDRLKDLFGDDFDMEMQAMLSPATLDIRVNTLKSNRQDVKKMLDAQGIETQDTPHSPVGLRLTSKAYLSKTKPFIKGMIEIQDEGSQILAMICNAKPGQQVLDYCAGGGGKTLALAASMDGKGRIIAMDIEERRLAKAKPRLTKAGVHNVELRPILEDKHRKWLKRQKETFDLVLLDVPCSSSGTWRRNPDLRWGHYGPSHAEIEEIQGDILNRVWDKVKIGGRMVYATCSLFKEENENQVEAFLNSNPNFKLVPANQVWAEAGLDGDYPSSSTDYIRLSPHRNQTDGFFAAVMERVS